MTFVTVMLVSNIYDVGIYFGKNGCTKLFTDPKDYWLN